MHACPARPLEPSSTHPLRLAAILLMGAASCLALGGCASAPPMPGLGARSATHDGATERVEMRFGPDVLVEQRRFDWCWAACCEMVSRAQRRPKPQEQFVADFKESRGQHDVQAATDLEIVRALAKGAPAEELDLSRFEGLRVDGDEVKSLLVDVLRLQSASSIAVEEFRKGRPIVMCLKDWEGAPGHAVFVTAIEFERANDLLSSLGREALKRSGLGGGVREASADYRVTRIEFFDPMMGASGIRAIDGAEIDRHVRYLLSPQLAKAVQRQMEKAVRISLRGGVR